MLVSMSYVIIWVCLREEVIRDRHRVLFMREDDHCGDTDSDREFFVALSGFDSADEAVQRIAEARDGLFFGLRMFSRFETRAWDTTSTAEDGRPILMGNYGNAHFVSWFESIAFSSNAVAFVRPADMDKFVMLPTAIELARIEGVPEELIRHMTVAPRCFSSGSLA